MGRRIKEMEMWREEQRREERKKNIVIKEMELDGKNVRESVEEIFGVMGEGIEQIRRVDRRGGSRERIVIVKLRMMEQKLKITKEKGKLVGRREILEDDVTWKERRIQWKIRRIMQRERWQGRRTK